MEYKTITEIKSLYVKGLKEVPQNNMQKWDDDYVVDPNMTDEENREMVEFHNKKYAEKAKKIKESKATVKKQVRTEIVKFLMGEYEFSQDRAEYIEQWVQSETREKTRQAYFDTIEVMADMIVGLPE